MNGAWKIVLGIALLGGGVGSAHAAFDPNEPLLVPGAFTTADTLRRSEWLVAPPPWGWLAYGATPRLTLGWDYPATLLGYPAGLVRYQLPADHPEESHYSLEWYAISFAKTYLDERSKGYRLEHRGLQSWLHLERSARLSDQWRWHLYAGANYATYQRYTSNEKVQFDPLILRYRVSPDFGVAVEWDARPWMKIHFNYTYGNTLYFVDQVALKHMIVGTLHFAPFGPNRHAVLRNLRFDLSAIYVDVPTAHYEYILPLPIYPTVYWQWGGAEDSAKP